MEFSDLSRGFRQGCMISTLLYIIVAETLAEAVWEDKKMNGVNLPDDFVAKWVEYADDGNATLSQLNNYLKF